MASILYTYVLDNNNDNDSNDNSDDGWMLSGSDRFYNVQTGEEISAEEYERRQIKEIQNTNAETQNQSDETQWNPYSPYEYNSTPQETPSQEQKIIENNNPTIQKNTTFPKKRKNQIKREDYHVLEDKVIKHQVYNSPSSYQPPGSDMDTSPDCSGKWRKPGIEKDSIETEVKVLNSDKTRERIRIHANRPKIAEPHIDPWLDLINMRHAESVKAELERRNDLLHLTNSALYRFKIQKIEDAFGDKVNLDYYSVTVRILPYYQAKRTTPYELFTLIRVKLSYFLDENFAYFSPYWDEDEERYGSEDYVKSVMHFDMGRGLRQLDDGSIIVSKKSEEFCIFTTITAPADLKHPVSGNRKFGFVENCDGTVTIYTRGADRCTSFLDNTAERYIFRKADELWTSHMKRIVTFINRSGGLARTNTPIISRPLWKELDKV